jgi:hypothetical protein
MHRSPTNRSARPARAGRAERLSAPQRGTAPQGRPAPVRAGDNGLAPCPAITYDGRSKTNHGRKDAHGQEHPDHRRRAAGRAGRRGHVAGQRHAAGPGSTVGAGAAHDGAGCVRWRPHHARYAAARSCGFGCRSGDPATQLAHADQGQVVSSRCIAHLLFSRHLRRAIGAHQLGPDAVPVVGAQVPAHHSAIGGEFNGAATLKRYGFKATRPLRHHHRAHSDHARDLGCSASFGHVKVKAKVHEPVS